MQSKQNFPRMALFVPIIIFVILADQFSKWLVVRNLGLHESVPFIPHFLDFLYIRNEGAAWGIFSNQRWIFLVITTIAIIGLPILLYHYRKLPLLFGISLSMIIGGAIGNMIDRVFLGSVVDFIHTLFMDFPVFNIADCFVVVGAILMFIYLIFIDKEFFRTPKKGAPESTSQIEDGHADSNP